MSLYPSQDSFSRGEISPRLHARSSLELYKSGLSLCENFLTLPHGGLRKRGGTYFVGEVKDSSRKTRLIPFLFSSEQAYCLELGDFYLRVYAYGARVGTVEVATPWPEAVLQELMFTQSADEMWIVHKDYPPQILARDGHTSWSLTEFVFNDGPYGAINTTATTLTPASTGAVHPIMTSNTAPSGTVSASAGSATAYRAFDNDKKSYWSNSGATLPNQLTYDFPGTDEKVCDAIWMMSDDVYIKRMPLSFTFEGQEAGGSWIVLHAVTGAEPWGINERRYYEFNNKTAYRGYRLNVSSVEDSGQVDIVIPDLGWHEAGDTQTPFNLTASSTVGINDDQGFLATDVGRSIRLLGSDNVWRWARIAARVSATIVTIRLYGHSLPDLNPIVNWRMNVFEPGQQVDSVAIFEERLSFARRFSVYASRSFDFESFATGEKDDDALIFSNAGGGQANDIVWLAEGDGDLLIATSGGIRALSGSGFDEALTPTSFKNRRSRTFGCARVAPVDAGESFLYVARGGKALIELTRNATGRFSSSDVGQISEHIGKRGIVELAFQSSPEPIVFLPLANGEVGGYTHQPSQEVRGWQRHRLGGAFGTTDWGVVESAAATPGQNGYDDVWFLVKRTVNGLTRRYIEIMAVPFEYGAIQDAFAVDCGLTYEGPAVTMVSGADHLTGESVDVLADGKVYRGLTVNGLGQVSLPPGSPAAATWQLGLPFEARAGSLELDVGGRDGSLLGRRKRISKLILSVLETDLSGLEITSLMGNRWEKAKLPTIAAASAVAQLYSGTVEVPIDDSWDGQGRFRLRHVNPTPCTIAAVTPCFDSEP